MYTLLPNFHVLWFRRRVFAWMMLIVWGLSLLPSVSVSQQTISEEVDIKAIQTLLQELGYDPGPLDGIMGKKTTTAIKAFQTDMNVPNDGQPSPELLAVLHREIIKVTEPTATISALNGTVLVNGQTEEQGTVLIAGDVIETQAGATVELTFSDGSTLEIEEQTQVELNTLTQTATGGRISYLMLLAGQIRAFLSSKHQQKGSAFTVETPNARIDATFSEPDIEVSYNLERLETVGIAHTVELMARNLATDEEMLVPVGFTVIITSEATKVIAGILLSGEELEKRLEPVPTPEPVPPEAEVAAAEITAAETTAAATTTGGATAGISTGKMIAIGTGALAAAGGVVAIAGGGDGGDDGDGGSGTPTYNIAGTWLMTETLTAENPNGWTGYPLGWTEDGLVTITQNGNTFTTDEDGDIRQGTISGNTFTFTGTADCGGRPDITGTITGEGKFTSDQTLEGTYQVECISITGERYVATVSITGIKL